MHPETGVPETVEEALFREFNLAIVEELLREENPKVTQDEINKIYSMCAGNPWSALLLYKMVNTAKKSVSFDLTLFDDEQSRHLSLLLNRLEIMFDDARNTLPDDYYYFADKLPFGSKVRVTFEVVS